MLLHVSRTGVQTARAVLDKAAPEIVAKVQRGEMAVSLAAGSKWANWPNYPGRGSRKALTQYGPIGPSSSGVQNRQLAVLILSATRARCPASGAASFGNSLN